MALDPETERLMLNWAAWKVGSRTGVASSSAYDSAASGWRGEGPIPLIDGDAVMVDKAVESLPDGLKIVLTEHWVRTDELAQKLKRCRCTQATYYRRLDDGHWAVRAYVEALRAADARVRQNYAQARRC